MSVNTYIDGQLKPVGAVMNYDAVQTIQVSELPEPGSSCLGRIYQYTGATTEDYIHAFFYECIYDETASIYKWQIIDVNDISNISNGDIATMWAEGAVTPSDVDVIPLEVDENGTYTAPEGTAYSPVTVNVQPALERVLLYGAEDYSTPAVVGTPYNWNDNLSNYDSICVVSSTSLDFAGSGQVWNHFFDVQNLLETGIHGGIALWARRFAAFIATDTTFTVTSSSPGTESSGYTPLIYKVYGYKQGVIL